MSLPAPPTMLRRALRPVHAMVAAALLALAMPATLLAQQQPAATAAPEPAAPATVAPAPAAPVTVTPAAAVPATIAPAAASSAFGELMGIVLPLVLIIVALLAVLYLVRRRFGLTGQDAPLSILQILPLGPRERLVLVRSRSGRIFTVGVAAHGVTLVTHLEPGDLIAPAADGDDGARDTAQAGETAVMPDRWRRIFAR